MDGLIKLRMQRDFIGALCRPMSSCNQSEREMLFLEGIPIRESLVIITTRGVGTNNGDNIFFLRNAGSNFLHVN